MAHRATAAGLATAGGDLCSDVVGTGRAEKLLAGYPHWREPWLPSHATR